MSEKKRLSKSSKDKVFLGICGGIANYFDSDPVLARSAYVILTIFTGFVPGILGYIILGVIIPEEGNA